MRQLPTRERRERYHARPPRAGAAASVVSIREPRPAPVASDDRSPWVQTKQHHCTLYIKLCKTRTDATVLKDKHPRGDVARAMSKPTGGGPWDRADAAVDAALALPAPAPAARRLWEADTLEEALAPRCPATEASSPAAAAAAPGCSAFQICSKRCVISLEIDLI